MPDVVPPSIIPPSATPPESPSPEPSQPLSPNLPPNPGSESPTPPPAVGVAQPAATNPVSQVFGAPAQTRFDPYTDLRPENQSAASPFQAASSAGPKPLKRRLWTAAAVVAVLLAAAAGYVFAFYLPNTPERVYSASLVNTGKAIDALIDYSKRQAQINYQSASLDGNLTAKTGGTSYSVNLSGAANKDGDGAFQLQISTGLVPAELKASLRVIHAKANIIPDTYIQISGFKSWLDKYGLAQLDRLDGQWIVFDHNFTNQYKSEFQNLKQSATSLTLPTTAEVQDAEAKVQAVNKQYLFTTDPARAVLANEQFVDKVTQNGRTLDHYRVGYNKAHLAAYVRAIGAALNSSQLNNWAKAVGHGKDFAQPADINSFTSGINKAKGDYTFDLFADTKTKLISKLTFSDLTTDAIVFSIAQNYTGGTSYPFSFSITGTHNGSVDTGNLGLNLDTTTHKTTVTLSATEGANDQNATNLSANFTLTPSKRPFIVAVPSGAKSITSVLDSLGLGKLAKPGSLQPY